MNTLIIISLSALTLCYGSVLNHGTTVLTGINTLGSHSLGLGYGYSGSTSGLGYGNGHGLGYGSEIAYLGYGSGLGYSGYGGHKTIIAATPAVVTTQVLSSPILLLGYGHGYGNGLKYGSGLGYSSGYTSYNGHGVTVKGPSTIPAVISGPSGKIVANGLHGVPNHGW